MFWCVVVKFVLQISQAKKKLIIILLLKKNRRSESSTSDSMLFLLYMHHLSKQGKNSKQNFAVSAVCILLLLLRSVELLVVSSILGSVFLELQSWFANFTSFISFSCFFFPFSVFGCCRRMRKIWLRERERKSQGGNLLFPFIEHFDDILRERERERE